MTLTKFSFVYLICIKSFTFSQSNNYITIDSSGEIFKAKRLFLLGEIHDKPQNARTEIAFLKLMNSLGIYTSYNIQEASPSVAYVLNKFLITGSWSEFGQDIFVVDTLTIKELRNYNLSLPKEHQFKFVGVDIEPNIHLAFFCIRREIQDSKLVDSANDPILKEILNQIIKKGYAWNWGKKDLISDLDLLIEYMEKNIDSVVSRNDQIVQILNSFKLGRCFKKLSPNNEPIKLKELRENFMINNISALLTKDTSSIAFGRFGLFHVLQSCKGFKYNKYSIASEFNNNNKSTINNKVYSSAIYYTSLNHKAYKVLIKDQKSIKKMFSNKITLTHSVLTDTLVNNTYVNSMIIVK